ncbi:MAG: hypothetical protein ACC653_11270 [Gammaproteobacteria bacterium]
MPLLSRQDIIQLFESLNDELRQDEINGELYLVGGAVMCLAFQSRPSTRDIDALFVPANEVRLAAGKVARKMDIDIDWLNDAVKGYLSPEGEFDLFLELDHLRVLIAQPEYLLAMKCLAMRIGEEYHDEDDIRYLLRYLNIESYSKAIEIISAYYPSEQFPQKTLYALEELLQK